MGSMIQTFKRLLMALVVVTLAACGGGDDEAGTPIFDSDGSTAPTVAVELQRGGTATSNLSTSETVRAVATVRDSNGTPIPGVIVTFVEAGAGLLSFAPESATSLTDQNGVASVEVRAASTTSLGATRVEAGISEGDVAVTGSAVVEVVQRGSVAVLPAAITFVSSVPADTAIVVKGAGGSGRSESAVLTFKVVAADGAPLKDSDVAFRMNADNGGATFAPAAARTDAEGLVTVTVTSGAEPASIVITASSATVPSISTQSGSLIVSNSVAVAAGFEVVSEKYNLDGRFTGDSTKVSAFVRDEFGNPVPDGLAVSFGTDYGAIASSTLGGCLTVNGQCSVDFRVQDPRGGGLATVIGQVRVGDSLVLSRSIRINMAAATGTSYVALTASGEAVRTLDLGSSTCKRTFELRLSDGNVRAPAAGTTISVAASSTGVTASLKSGSPVADRLDRSPAPFTLEVEVGDADMVDPCDSAGSTTSTSENFVLLEFTTPKGVVFQQRLGLAYPLQP